MKILSTEREITFDDILLLPNYSEIKIEDESDIKIDSNLTRKIKLDIPIISSPMPGVTEDIMAIKMSKMGGLGFIHHFQPLARQLEQVKKVKLNNCIVGASVWPFDSNVINHIKNLIDVGVDIISIESPQANNLELFKIIKDIKSKFKYLDLSVSLVVDAEATEAVIKAGADSVRVGIGGGSHCTTRIVTGVGRSQLSAVADCYSVASKYKIPLISDTGIRFPGDIAKAIIFGAETVMIGGLLSGTAESPGKIIYNKGVAYKQSWGMCTDTAMKHKQLQLFGIKSSVKKLINEAKNIIKSGHINPGIKLFEEGVEALIPYKGSADEVISQLVLGLKRSMWYQGSKDLSDLRKKARITIISQSTYMENLPRV